MPETSQLLPIPKDSVIVDHPTAINRDEWEDVASEYRAAGYEVGLIESPLTGRILLWRKLLIPGSVAPKHQVDEALSAFDVHFHTDRHADLSKILRNNGGVFHAVDIAHVVGLVEVPMSAFPETRRSVLSISELTRAAAVLRQTYPDAADHEFIVTFTDGQDWPVIIRTETGALGVVISPRKENLGAEEAA